MCSFLQASCFFYRCPAPFIYSCSPHSQLNGPMRVMFHWSSYYTPQICFHTRERHPERPGQAGTSVALLVANCSPSSISYTSWTVNVEQTKTSELQKGRGKERGSGGGGAKKRKNRSLWSKRSSPRLPPRSVLSASRHFKLAKGCDEVIVGPLVICQLHVSRPDHHHHVHPSFFSCFSLCNEKYEYRDSIKIIWAC